MACDRSTEHPAPARARVGDANQFLPFRFPVSVFRPVTGAALCFLWDGVRLKLVRLSLAVAGLAANKLAVRWFGCPFGLLDCSTIMILSYLDTCTPPAVATPPSSWPSNAPVKTNKLSRSAPNNGTCTSVSPSRASCLPSPCYPGSTHTMLRRIPPHRVAPPGSWALFYTVVR